MTQVSTQEELRAALLVREPDIQVIADFDVAAQQSVTYPLLLHSAPGAAIHTISKTAGFSGNLLRVSGGGALTLENLVLDGSAAGSYVENPANRTLLQAAGGSVHLGSGAVLQNNSSYQEGGGVYLSGDPSYVNTLLMDGNAVIRSCSSRTSGGGLTAALRNSADSVRLAGEALIEQNTAANGGGVYLRSYLAEVGGALSIGEQVQIRNNQATANGGGVYCSSFSSGGGAPVSLLVEGEVEISSNHAASGGGIYFYSANQGDRLTLTSLVRIAKNTVTGSGGGVYLSAPRDSVQLSIQGAFVTDNHAANGGGLYLRTMAGGTLEMTEGTTLSGNEAAGAVSSAGGGVWIQNAAGTLDVTVLNASLLANRAAANGGGLFLSNSGTLRLSANGGSISSNTAGASGGGAYLTGTQGAAGTLTLDGVTVSDNKAGTTGGGLCLGSGAGALGSTLDNCTIRGNAAHANSGGGIWSGGSNDTLLIRSGTVITQNSTESGNGGGVYFNSEQGALTLSGDAEITYNRADSRESGFGGHGGGVCVVPGRVDIRDRAELSHNSAGKFGGGLSAAEGSVIAMSGGSIRDNQSGQEGGGVWNHMTSRFTQTGGSIEHNAAPVGGGLYNDAASVASILGGMIQGNTSTQYASGVYNGGALYTQGLRELSNGLYLENRGAAVQLSDALAEGTVLQLENSGYVTPNSVGAPIVVGEATPQYPRLSQADADGFLKPPTGFDGWEIRLSEDSTQVLLAPAVYALRYENTMGGQNPNPTSYTVLTPAITLLPLAGTAGDRFLGWYDAPEGGTQVTEVPLGSTGDKTLYARWEAIKYTVTYYGNDAGGPAAENVPQSQQVRGGGSVLLSDARPTRTGYIFTGWNTTPDGTGASYPPGGTIPGVQADTGLYAQWEALPPPLYLVTYEPNDAGGPPAQNVPAPQRFPEGQTAVLSATVPTRTGYDFQNWNSRSDGGGETYLPGQNAGPIYADLTLYAQWRYVEYVLTYHGNDAGGPPARNIPDQQAFHVGQTVRVSDTVPAREGFRFLGWNTRPDGGGAAYRPGASFGPAAADADLYAQWEAVPPTVYLLSYAPNDAGGPPAQDIPGQREVSEGETAALSARIPTRSGYRFLGWNTASDGTGGIYQPGQTVGPFYGDLTLYAQWKRVEHTLTYHGNDEAGPPAQWVPFPQPVPEGVTISLPDAIPTRVGFRFTGWNTRAEGSGDAYRPGGPFGPIFADADLYAQWVALPPTLYTLTYRGNDAGGPAAQNIPGPVPVPDGQSVTLSDAVPTREGFVFSGWNTDPGGTGTAYRPDGTIPEVRADIDLYAQWTLLPPAFFTLSYCGNDAGGLPACGIPCPQQVPAGQCVQVSCETPYRSCYCFAGWNTDPCGGGRMVYPGQTISPVTGDICLYAQWRRLPPPKPCCACREEPD